MSNSLGKKTNLDKTDPKVQFTTENIGRWASRQENPFAEQNRRTQAKRQESNKKRQKAAPYVVVSIAVVLVGLAVWGLVALIMRFTAPSETEITYTPEISGSTSEDISKYRDLLQDFYDEQKNNLINNGSSGSGSGGSGNDGNNNGSDGDNSNGSGDSNDSNDNKLIEDINKVVDNTLNTPSGQENANAVYYAQLSFYFNNSLYREAISISDKINQDLLTAKQLSTYYNMLGIAYYNIGDTGKTDEYYDKLYSMTLDQE